MTHIPPAGRFVVVLVLAALGVATVHAGRETVGQAPAKDVVEQVLVKVNSDIITKTDLETRQSSALRAQKVNPRTISDAELSKVLAEITPQIIVFAVDELLMLQRGRELGFRPSDDEFRKFIERIKKENNLETEEQFQAALKAENLTTADLRLSFEKNGIIQQVQDQEIMRRITISESEARAYYDAHKDELTTPATMMLREILIGVPVNKLGFSVGADEAAKAKADAVHARLTAGESFEKAVAAVSEAPSKANGGLIGPISLSDIVPALRELLAPLKAGDMTGVIRTASGYQIYKVDTLTPATVLSWEQAREEIGNRVANTKQAAEFAKYIVKLRAQAVIQWKNAELKKLYDQRVALETR